MRLRHKSEDKRLYDAEILRSWDAVALLYVSERQPRKLSRGERAG